MSFVHPIERLLRSALHVQDEGFGRSHAERILRDGFLIMRGAVHEPELADLRRETANLLAKQVRGSGYRTLRDQACRNGRIEEIGSSSAAALSLLAHPVGLRAMHQLHGADFIPTLDVLQCFDARAQHEIHWHCGPVQRSGRMQPSTFRIAYQLDECAAPCGLWLMPGSHLWGDIAAETCIQKLNGEGCDTTGAVPVNLSMGDAVIYDARVILGQRHTVAVRCRVLEYEFRSPQALTRSQRNNARYLKGCLRKLRTARAQRLQVSPFFKQSCGERSRAGR